MSIISADCETWRKSFGVMTFGVKTRRTTPTPPRMPTRLLLSLFAIALSIPVGARTNQPQDRRVLVRAGRLIDVASDAAKTDQGILITGDRITRVGPYTELAAAAGNAERVDMSRYTVLPGFIDAHTHVFLDGGDYATQVLKQSIPFRTIEAVTAARAALGYGFTSVRDLE